MDETKEHLSATSGIATGQEADADPKFFTIGRPTIFGS
jgi:hypothetical protein